MKNDEALRNIRLRFISYLMDTKNKNTIDDAKRRAFYKWIKNTSTPKTSLPNTEKALSLMRKAGEVVSEVFRQVGPLCIPGVNTLELANKADKIIRSHGATPQTFEEIENSNLEIIDLTYMYISK